MPTVLVPRHVADDLERRFRQAAPGADLQAVPYDIDGTCLGDPRGAEALFQYFPYDRFPGRGFSAAELRRVWAAAPQLRWVQSNASGVDSLLFPELIASDVLLTSGASVNSGPVAESVLALLLAIAKRIPQHADHQRRREWKRYTKLVLRGATVVVIGYGHIGEEVGRLCKAFGMRVVAVRRDPTRDSPHADAVFGADDLASERRSAIFRDADFVILTLAATRGHAPVIGEAELAAMPTKAWLANVARGSMVEESALIRALQEGRIAGAALDVFQHEPLSTESPLWGFPNVLITPHNSASSPLQDRHTLELFAENFRRWISGEPLLNQVDKRRGY
jgi:phosphoglycerate dehydrogenase-like enzyme